MNQKLLRFVPFAGDSPGGSAGRRVLQALVLILALLFPSHQAKAEQWGDQHITINTDNFEQYGYFDVTFEAFYKYRGLSADDAKNKYGSARIKINDKYVAFITGSEYPYCLSERPGKQPYSDRAVLHVEKSSTDVAEVRVIKKNYNKTIDYSDTPIDEDTPSTYVLDKHKFFYLYWENGSISDCSFLIPTVRIWPLASDLGKGDVKITYEYCLWEQYFNSPSNWKSAYKTYSSSRKGLSAPELTQSVSDKAGKFDFSFTPINAGDYYCFDDGDRKTTSSSKVTDQVDIVNLTHDVTFRYGYAPNDFQDLFFTRSVTVPAYMIPNEGDFTAVLSSPSTVELTWTVPAYDGEQYKDDQWVVERDDNKDFTHPSTVCQKPFSVGETQYSYTQDISELNINGTQYYRLRRTAVSKWGWADAVTRKAQVDIATEHRFVANPKATMYHYNTEVTITWDWTGSIWSKNSKLTIVRTNEMRGTIATINVPAEDIEKQTYIDKLPTTCDVYSYKMYVVPGSSSYAAQEEVAVAEPNGKLYCASMGQILSLETSKGYYGDRTILKWTTNENPIESFAIMSREHGSEANFNQIGQLAASAGSTNYTFKDDMCVPGVIYDYQVLAITTCGGETQSKASATVLGFSGATGTVNGRITYGSGQAVKDVVVRAVPEESDMTQNMAYYSTGASTNAGLMAYLEVNDGSLMKNATNSATIQVWAKIEDEGELVTKPGMFTLAANDYGKAVLTAGSDTLVSNRKVGWSWREDDDDTPLEYFQLTAVITPDSLLMYVNGEKDSSVKRTDAIFGEDTKVQLNRLRGTVDEVRLWSKALDAKTIAYNYNTYLAGNEDGLEAYYTFNPCTDTEFWDRSRVGNEYRKRDGVVINTRSKVAKFYTTTDTPTLDQLSHNGITDEDGSYTLRDVPYYGNGTSYTLVPDLGIHKFDPTKEMRFLSKNTENFTVNFTDVSSFPVSGVVYYENTNYPVEGCNLYVDGTVCTKDGELIATDKDGRFEISVPIGDHFIEIRKSEMGHTFANAGRYPSDPHGIGLRHTFDRAMTGLTFYESTLVNFSGRVTGGNVEGGKTLGLGESVNTIGQVELVLQASNPDYSLNVTRTVGESGLVDVNKNTETLPVAAAKSGKSSYTFGSEAWRGAKVGDVDNTKTIYIRTDKETGEFSAMLPPLKYKLLEAKIVKTNESVISADQGLPEYDLTNPSMTVRDSVECEDGTVLSYECHKQAMITHHTTPMFSVKDKNAQAGAFGIKEYTVSDQYGKATIDDIYTVDGNGKVTYRHGAPLFVMCDPYEFLLEGYEEYTNADNGTVSKEPLAGVVVTIANNLADNQPVYYEGDNAGQVADGQNTLVTLDENGQAVYRWKGGLPNISESPDPNVPDYSRTISMSYEVDGRTYQWDGNPLHGIVLGSLTTGTNFVTAGPDKVEMVLRDPPGTASHAEWTEGTTHTITNTIAGIWSLEDKLETTTQLGIKQEIAVGVGVATINKLEVDNDIKVGVNIKDEGENAKTSVTTITTERTISTSDGIDFVGSKGDIYIGRSTNVTFGKARQVGLTRESETAPIALTKKDVISTGLSFGTVFNYTQFYIETVLIPNLEAMLEEKLITYDGDIESYTNNTDKPVYLTHWKPGDENYGKRNFENTELALAQIFGKPLVCGPNYWMINPSNMKPDDCFQDEVNWLIEQIANWKQTIANNEKDKVMAYKDKDTYFDKNISFDSGAKVSYTWRKEETKSTMVENKFTTLITGGTQWGAAINGIGVTFELECENGGGVHTVNSEDNTKATQFVYELAEDGNNDALTVDVLKSPAGWSPIFHTVAGQTSAPYEGKEETKYYEPGQHVLNEATMQVEVPKIGVEVATLSDVPTGSAANFTLLLTNESESDADVFYKLLMLEHSNTNGATLKIDGEPLTDGRRFRIAAGETVKKLLQLSQSDYSVLDYENIGIVLASESQVDIIADTTYVTAHFVPSSSDVSLHIDRPLLNSTYGDELTLRFDNFDRNFHQLKAFRVQYKRKGDGDWTTAQEYVVKDADVTNSNKLLPTGASVPFVYDMHSMNDDEYTFRILSVATYGTSEVTRSSNEITIVKDMARPQLISLPSPTDGILNVGDEIALTFNEDIRQGAIKANEANFIIRGKLNNAKVSHDGVFQSAGGEGARTSTALNLEGRPFAVGAWVKWTGAGSVFRHGTADKYFDVSITSEGKLKATIEGTSYVSDKTVPQGKWCYLNVSYDNTSGATRLDANVAYEGAETQLFALENVASYTGNGAITVGDKINAAIHEVTLWNNWRTWAMAKNGMNQTHAASTDGLIGYWHLDEGHGTVGEDKARSRHLALPAGNSWSMENDNYALTLDGKSYAALDLSKTGSDEDQNYMLEFWFRADKQAADATIMHVHKGVPASSLELVAANDGSLSLNVDGETTIVTTDNMTDNAWHHFSLNVLKGISGMATAYVDGVAKAQISADKLPAVRTDKLVMGAHRTYNGGTNDNYAYSQYFKGDIDEVRFWNATQTAALIRDNMYNKVDAETASSLALYYPFEKRTVDSGNQSVITADLADHSAIKGANAVIGGTTSIVPTKSSLGLKAAPQLENVPYSFVASERKILIDITADQQLIEGCTLQMTVRDIQDMNGNNCNEIKWNAYVSQSQLAWGEGEVSVVKEGTNATSFDVAIVNTSGEMADWTLSGMPSWLSASSESGSLMPLTQKTLTFTVDEATAIGRYEAVVGLSGANGVTANLVVNLLVTGERPNWSVNADDYENSTSIVARLVIGGTPSEDSDDIVAAFVDGECRGVGHPEYYSRYDSYMVMMNIYGNSDSDKKVTFRAFDASTGDVYPEVNASTEVKFVNDFVTGTPANPVVLTATDNLEQSIETRAGWNWISLYVESSDMSVGNVLSSVDGSADIVKDKGSMASYETDGWLGSLSTMAVGSMYKLNMNSPAALSVIGKRVDPQAADRAITVSNGNNWIGYSASYYLSPDEAFAGLSPENEDVIKSKESFAIFMDYEWVGPLKALEPGKGYLYKSQASGSKTFNYPKKSVASKKAPVKAPAAEGQARKYTTCPITKYEGNMNIVAQAWKDNQPIECEIAVFDSKGECRGSELSMYDSNLVFLTVQGEGEGEPLTIRVVYNDNGTVCDQLIDQVVYFKNDAIIGKASKPMVIDLDGLTGIDGIDADSDETEYYNLHGVKVSDKYKGLKVSKGNKLITK